MKDDEIRIVPLGGLGEIGLNCQLWETENSAIMIDCGMMFPEDAHPGIDALIPHLETIQSSGNKIAAIILTHGHEDHIGALPWIIPALPELPIYASPFTLALVRHKLQEHGLLHKVKLSPVLPGETVRCGDLIIHFFPVTHSIPQSYALGAETPAGKIIHSGDFRLEHNSESNPGEEFPLLREFAGEKGVRLLLSDSTNVLRETPATTESEVRDSLKEIFASAKGRIVITLFSSHIERIQEVFDLADQFGREVIISGKSLASNIGIATELGCASLPGKFHNAFNGVPDLPPEKMVLIVTGAQGEPLAALSRMVLGSHRQLDILPGDTVIMSSRVIPGHGRQVTRLINEMYRSGAEVYYEGSHSVHASGHANASDLAKLIKAARPQLFMPIHGEYHHLLMHSRLAEKEGIASDNIFCIEDGQPVIISPHQHELEDRFSAECTLVDGKGVGDIGPAVLRERKILSDEGIITVAATVDADTGTLLGEPEIATLGVIYEPLAGDILLEARKIAAEELGQNSTPEKMRENIRSSLRRYFRRTLERDPMVICMISQINRSALPGED